MRPDCRTDTRPHANLVLYEWDRITGGWEMRKNLIESSFVIIKSGSEHLYAGRRPSVVQLSAFDGIDLMDRNGNLCLLKLRGSNSTRE